MTLPPKPNINTEESFERLARAPIVEAALAVTARAEAAFDESAVIAQLKLKLPDYPAVYSGRLIQHSLKETEAGPSVHIQRDLGWNALRLQSQDGRQIALFGRNGFSFSRLEPYETWEKFRSEALRLWQLHVELFRPTFVERLGLRYIDRIPIDELPIDLDEILNAAPKTPRGLELAVDSFLHQDNLCVPHSPYFISIIQTAQQVAGPTGPEPGLFLDIDVAVATQFELKEGVLEHYLAEMRWLKNKAFFGSLTPQTLTKLRVPKNETSGTSLAS